MACPNCGSWSVRADRSLAGRMVCGRCGSPLSGTGAQGRRSRPQNQRRRRLNSSLARLNPGWWGLIVLLGLGAGLALLEPPQGRQQRPLPGGGLDRPNLLPQANQSAQQTSTGLPPSPSPNPHQAVQIRPSA